MSKYFSRKTTLDGITFDSKAEAERYAELKLLEKSGEIYGLALQPSFELIPKYRKHGRTVRAVNYIADFLYIDRKTNQMVVEDVKGYKTEVYRLKKKILEYKYPGIEIKEVHR